MPERDDGQGAKRPVGGATERLTTLERVRLFLDVCAAVQYAHQNLVVHRDLKPSNILVTPGRVPKLLDFGIAKLLKPDLAPDDFVVTRTAERPMTLAYASPEQIRGGPITTASDVYSLGVVLYELLTGRLPSQGATPLEMERAICELPPDKPSTAVAQRGRATTSVTTGTPGTPSPSASADPMSDGRPERIRRQLAGDLDTIVLMALRKEPARRYGSVEQLAADLRRYLDGRPVLARKPTLAYRTAKFVRRNQGGVASALLVLLALVTASVVTARQAQVARVEKARAERRFNDVRKLANSFLFEFHDAIRSLPGSTPARELVVKRAREYLDSLSAEAPGDSALARELATSYIRVGDVQGAYYFPNLGDTAGALASYGKGAMICEPLCQGHSRDAASCMCLALAYRGLGELRQWLGRVRESVDDLRAAVRALEPVGAAQSGPYFSVGELAGAYLSLGDKLGNPTVPSLGLNLQAATAYRQTQAALERLQADQPSLNLRRSFAYVHAKLAQVKAGNGDVAGALDDFRIADAAFRQLSQNTPTNATVRRDLALNGAYFARTLAEAGDLGAARTRADEALGIVDDLRKADPQNAMALGDLALARFTQGQILDQSRDPRHAVAHYQGSLAILEPALAADSGSVFLRSATGQVLMYPAHSLIEIGEVEEARHLSVRGLAVQRALIERAEATGPEFEAYARALLTCEPADLRDPQRARTYAERAVELTAGENPRALHTLALAYSATGDSARALEQEGKALALVPAPPPGIAVPLRRDIEANLARLRESATTKVGLIR